MPVFKEPKVPIPVHIRGPLPVLTDGDGRTLYLNEPMYGQLQDKKGASDVKPVKVVQVTYDVNGDLCEMTLEYEDGEQQRLRYLGDR